MADQEWLDTLKSGDEVVIRGGDRKGEPVAVKIERTTRAQIIVDGVRFNREGGYCRTRRGYFAEWLDRTDVGERRALTKKIRHGLINCYTWDRRLTTAELRQIADIVDAARARAEQARKDA